MTEEDWAALAKTTETITLIRRELGRCSGSTPHRDQLERELVIAEQNRAFLVSKLCEGAPSGIAA